MSRAWTLAEWGRSKSWYHGSPYVLETLREGSTITQDRKLAEVFSHKPPIVSVSDAEGIRHNGAQPGYLYAIAEEIQPGDVVPHSRSAMACGTEWLTCRELHVVLLGPTRIEGSQLLTEGELEALRNRSKVGEERGMTLDRSGGTGRGPSYDAIAERLLAWAQEWLPDFPWQHARDPYAIWVAVVMLQQTQVATVLPYYRRFLDRFPALPDLAAADLRDVLKAWEGLGYYARARNLHATARMVMEQQGGRLPADRRQLMALPGIGEYTAGAVLSIAFGQDEPAVDGNVRRVLCRLFAVEGDLRRADARRRLWDLARRLLPSGRAGDFNQGVMHLGSVVCKARRPDCAICPLGALCEARRLGKEEQIPQRTPRRAVPHYDVTAAVIWEGNDRVLIAQREADDMLGGMWEFPGGKCEPGESLAECLRREIREELDLEIEVGERLRSVQHAYSHFRITLHAFHCRPTGGDPHALGCAAWRWVRLGELPDFPFPVADQKIIAALQERRAGEDLSSAEYRVEEPAGKGEEEA